MTLSFGSTLFSFTNEWLASSRPVGDLLERVAAAGLGPDLELEAFTSFRGIPVPTDDEVASFRADCARLALRPTVLGVYVDRARRRDHWLDPDQSAAELIAQVALADRLGFRIVRAPMGLDLAVVERVLPALLTHKVVLTVEAQGSMTPRTPAVADLVDWLVDRPGAPVGLTLDASVAMTDLPPSFRRVLRQHGMGPVVEEVLDHWWRAEGPAPERMAGFRAAAVAAGVPPAVLDRSVTAFVRMGHGDVADWRSLAPWTRHVHAKYWDWEDAAAQVVAPHAALLRMLLEEGYSGSVSSEWGGSEWLGLDEVDAFALTRRHLGALRAAVV